VYYWLDVPVMPVYYMNRMGVDQSIYPQRSAQFFEIIVLCAPLSTNACPILV
jgi:hypothetical protein